MEVMSYTINGKQNSRFPNIHSPKIIVLVRSHDSTSRFSSPDSDIISIKIRGTMVYCSYNSISSSGSEVSRLFNPTSHKIVGSNGVSQSGLASPNSLVLNSEKEDLVNSTLKIGKKEASEAKTLAAMKNHSEAERRRRERINGHLDTLRGLVPNNAKMDKATLLGEVINQVKLLKNNAMEAGRGFGIPMDDDEVKVEPYNHEGREGSMFYVASICCDYQPKLLSELRQALDGLQLQLVRAEISTLGGRVKNVFFFRCCKTEHISIEACQCVPGTVHQVLSSVLEKAPSSLEYSLGMSLRSKRKRVCFIETSTSS